MNATPEELKAAWQNFHMTNFADFILWGLAFAAQREPLRLKEALARVFSSRAAESMSRQACDYARQAAREIHQTAEELRELLRAIEEDIAALEARLDRAARAFKKLAQPTTNGGPT